MLNHTKPIHLFVTHSLCWLCLAVFSSPAAALDTHWQLDPATPGDWFDAANWDNEVPTRYDNACVDNGGTTQITSPGAECNDLYLGRAVGQSGALELSGETSSLSSDDQCIGYSGTGTFTQTGGTNTVGSILAVAYDSGSSGTWRIQFFHVTASNSGSGSVVHRQHRRRRVFPDSNPLSLQVGVQKQNPRSFRNLAFSKNSRNYLAPTIHVN